MIVVGEVPNTENVLFEKRVVNNLTEGDDRQCTSSARSRDCNSLSARKREHRVYAAALTGSGLPGFASHPIEGMRMLVPEVHQHVGTWGTWALYVFAPLLLCGIVASLWLIVKGAIGVLRAEPRGERLSTIPSTPGSSSGRAAQKP